jgi:hypothetical protein
MISPDQIRLIRLPEALHKEGAGGDNVAVGWAKPGQATSAPSEIVPGSVLSPYQ